MSEGERARYKELGRRILVNREQVTYTEYLEFLRLEQLDAQERESKEVQA